MSNTEKKSRFSSFLDTTRRFLGFTSSNNNKDYSIVSPDKRFVASYKPPIESQVTQTERGESWWRDFGIEIGSNAEILSKNGWKSLTELKLGDLIATLSSEGKIEYQPITNIIREDNYRGEMYHFKNKHCDLIVTPHHRMLFRNADHYRAFKTIDNRYPAEYGLSVDGFQLIQAKDVYGIKGNWEIKKDAKWEGENPEFYIIEGDIKINQFRTEHQYLKLPIVPFLKLLAYYISEGSLGRTKIGTYNRIQIYQSTQGRHMAVREHIIDAITSFGFDAHADADPDSICLYNPIIATWLSQYGHHADTKRIPEFISTLSPELIRIFLEAYGEGDGSVTKTGTLVIKTVSPYIRDALQELALKAGWAADYHIERSRKKIFPSGRTSTSKTCYSITILKRRTTPTLLYSGKGISKTTSTSGFICLEVPKNHIFYVRANGKALWTGNSWEEYATKTTAGLGLGFTVYPYVAIWEKIWGAVPTEDYEKYKTYYIQDPFVFQTINLHTIMTVSSGFELDYPIESVKKDMLNMMRRLDFFNYLKVIVNNMLLFGNSYTEVVRTWICPHVGHDLDMLRVSYEIDYDPETGKGGYWWTDRVDIAFKHNAMYPDHKFENPYGELTMLKYLDPAYMRVRRDAYGQILGFTQYYIFPLVTFLADEVLHLRWMPNSWTYESVYGFSMIRPILYYEEAVRDFEAQMTRFTNNYLNMPFYLVKVGGQGKNFGQEATDAQWNAIRQAFLTRAPGREILVRSGALVEIQPFAAPQTNIQTLEFWLDWIHKMRYYSLAVPKFFIDPAGLNRASARTLENAYFTFISSIRTALSGQIENPQGGLFVIMMRSLYGELADELIRQYGVPQILWKPLHQDNMSDKIDNITKLFDKGLLLYNEARTYLGYRPLSEEEIEKATGQFAATGAKSPLVPSGGSLSDLLKTQTSGEKTTEKEVMPKSQGGSPEGGPNLEGGGSPTQKEEEITNYIQKLYDEEDSLLQEIDILNELKKAYKKENMKLADRLKQDLASVEDEREGS